MSGRKRSRRIPAPFNRAPPPQGVLPRIAPVSSFAPLGLVSFHFASRRLRGGLHSFAPSELMGCDYAGGFGAVQNPKQAL